jgi:hypothetical protein
MTSLRFSSHAAYAREMQRARLGALVAGSRWLGWMALSVLLALPPCGRVARAEAQAASALTCAVEGLTPGLRPADLCRAVGRELKRSMVWVDDARASKTGAAVQIIQGDVQWIVAFLVDGRVRAWTRVSKIEAASDQLRFLVNAARELAKVAPAIDKECVQVDPNGGRKMRSSDLTYPWAELKPCRRHSLEVVDPWWLSE